MKRLQDVACGIRSIRSRTNESKSAKIPLKEVTIAHNDPLFLDDIKHLESYLKEEINALNLNYISQKGIVNYTVQPNHKSLGQKYKAIANQVKSQMLQLSPTTSDYLSDKQTVFNVTDPKGETIEIRLDAEDYTIISNVNENLLSKPNIYIEVDKGNNLMLIVDGEKNAEVQELYHYRLFITIVQNMRKVTSLRPWNVIDIYYKTSSADLISILNKHSAKIAEELLYPITFSSDLSEQIQSPNLVIHKNTDLDGSPIEVAILSC
jgi:isoleucyl-tRNA synthetase